jgi:uncharacterized protein with NAD-binding domain and iron-sulfur cluster
MEKIAVLGGGIAGLTTALELTATPELRERYEVTLYQTGWRCGGKCSTGRNHDEGDRIEEHGLHLWFGGYDNAFRLLADCYRELDRPAGSPLATMDEAWTPLSSVVLYDSYQDRWTPSFRTFDVEPGKPWDDAEVPRFWDLLIDIVHSVDGQAHRLRSDSHPARSHPVGPVARALRRAGDDAERLALAAIGRVVDRHHRRDAQRRRHAHPVAKMLELYRDQIWRRHVRDHLDDDGVRDAFSQTDTMLTSVIGMIRDDLLWNGFESINDLDFADWLAKHGARPTTLQGPDVRVIYDQCFSGNRGPATTATDPVADGREGQQGMAAGAGLYSLVRTRLPYRGSIMWQANGGMGDTAIVPMYQTLVERGVAVKFFHHVTHLGVDPEQRVVDTIDVLEQLQTIGDYQPLRNVNGLPCWPDRPLWEHIVGGDELAGLAVRYELGEAAPTARSHTLRRGEHFDQVVLAISAAALPAICGEVMAASPAFRAMLDNTTTIMTQAFQLWLDQDPSELGFPYGHTATSTFVEPLDTGCDNSQVLWSESWPAGKEPRSVWYFCGDLLDIEGDDFETATERARAGALDYLAKIGAQWPGAVGAEGFRWDVLHAPDGVAGAERFEHQFWRANIAPTERYVQTMPGSVRHRLKADESGLHNLVLSGDWIKNGFDIGAVEATVMSGMQAARAISGFPAHIAWDDHRWMIDE